MSQCDIRSLRWSSYACFQSLFRALICLLVMSGAYPLLASAVRYDGAVTHLGSGTVSNPSGVAVDFAGNLYIADTNHNRIVKVIPDGTTSTLAISGLSTSLNSPRGLALDSSGNLYIADTGNSRIVKVSSSGSGSVVSTPTITLSAPQGVAVDISGNIFISDTGNNEIVKLSSGGTASVFNTSSGVSISPTPTPSLSAPKGVAVDTYGNLYIVDSGNNRVIKVTTGLVGSVITSTLSPALNNPTGITVGNNGLVYITDTNGSPIRVAIIDPQGNHFDLFNDDVNSEFGVPTAIALSSRGAIYIADTQNNEVNAFQLASAAFGNVQLGSSGTPVTLQFTVDSSTILTGLSIYTAGTPNLDFTVAANSQTPCATGISGVTCTVNVQFTPTTAGLRSGALVLSYSSGSVTVPLFGIADAPVSVLSPAVASVVNVGSTSIGEPFQTVYDGVGNIYVTSYENSAVYKIPAGGGSASKVTISNSSITLSNPTGLAMDGAGNLFIADYLNSRLVEVTSAGTSSVVTINGLSLSYPTALAFDGAGNLIVNDYGNGRIVKLTPDPSGDGTVGTADGYVLAMGTYTLAALNSTGSTVDAAGNVYVVDPLNDRILKIDPLGVTTVLDLSSVGALSGPQGVAVDPSQNIYLIDSGNKRIILRTVSGSISVMSFSGATLGSNIFGLTVDNGGDVLVSDFTNRRLLQISVGRSSLTFPNTTQYKNSPSQNVTVSNLGDSPLIFSANPTYTADFSQDTTDTNPCMSSTTLTSGKSCDVSIMFSPQSVGTLSANIVVASNNLNTANFPQPIVVSGISNAPDTTSTAISITPTSASYGQSFTMSVKVSDTATGHTSIIPTGTITFTDTFGTTITQLNNGNAISLNSSGSATLSGVVLNGIGPHTIAANYSGVTGSYQASSNTGEITVTQVVPAITWNTSGSISYGTSLNGLLTATATNGSATIPGSFAYTATPSGGSPVSVTSATILAAGSYTLTASFTPADTTTYATKTSTAALVVEKTSAAASLVSSASSVPVGSPITFTATVASPSGTPTGTVSFYDGTTLLATVALSQGQAVYTTSSLAVGTHSIAEVYSGDSNFLSNTSSAVGETVGKQTTATALFPSANPVLVTNAVTFMSTVASSSGTPTGTVSLYDRTTLLATVALSQGQAVYTASSLAVGTHSITAVYSGDSNFSASTSAAVVEIVGKATSAISLVSSLNPALVTNAVTFTATTTSSISGTLTGSISFYDGNTLLGTAALSQGSAALTTSSLAVGSHLITAVYSGDTNFTASTSSGITESIQDFTVSTPTSSTTDTPSASVAPGGTATFSLQIGPAGGAVFPAPVTLSLSGLPPGATGTLSPTTLPAGSSLSSVTLTIQLPQQTAALHPDVHRDLKMVFTMFALLFLPFAGRMRRTAKGLRRTACLVILFVIGAGALVGLSGCGAKTSGFFGQAEKSYTILITATSGNVSHATAVNLTVQ